MRMIEYSGLPLQEIVEESSLMKPRATEGMEDQQRADESTAASSGASGSTSSPFAYSSSSFSSPPASKKEMLLQRKARLMKILNDLDGCKEEDYSHIIVEQANEIERLRRQVEFKKRQELLLRAVRPPRKRRQHRSTSGPHATDNSHPAKPPIPLVVIHTTAESSPTPDSSFMEQSATTTTSTTSTEKFMTLDQDEQQQEVHQHLHDFSFESLDSIATSHVSLFKVDEEEDDDDEEDEDVDEEEERRKLENSRILHSNHYIKRTDDHVNSLILAVLLQHEVLIAQIVEMEPKLVQKRSKRGDTALHYALYYCLDDVTVFRLLVTACPAAVLSRTESRGLFQKHLLPLEIALHLNAQEEIINLLRQAARVASKTISSAAVSQS